MANNIPLLTHLKYPALRNILILYTLIQEIYLANFLHLALIKLIPTFYQQTLIVRLAIFDLIWCNKLLTLEH